jgi:hypothetical protein
MSVFKTNLKNKLAPEMISVKGESRAKFRSRKVYETDNGCIV